MAHKERDKNDRINYIELITIDETYLSLYDDLFKITKGKGYNSATDRTFYICIINV